MEQITQKFIAEKLGISVMTVSRVINNKEYVDENTRKKVLKLIDKENYFPNQIAKALRTNKISSIGIVMRSGGNVFAVPFFVDILKGIEEVCIGSDYDIVLSPSGQVEFQYQKIIRERKADGFIIVAPEINDPQINFLLKSKIPFVVISNYGTFNYVDSDNFQGAYDITKYLIELGHKKIAFIKGFPNVRNPVNRLIGFEKAMNDFNRKIYPEFIFDGRYDIESGIDIAEKIIKMKNKPDAVFSSNDLMAVGLIKKLQEYKISIPGDISVAGFDNIQLSNYITPSLTTVDQQTYLLGKKATSFLLELIDKPGKKYQEKISTKLIIRQSCKSRK